MPSAARVFPLRSVLRYVGRPFADSTAEPRSDCRGSWVAIRLNMAGDSFVLMSGTKVASRAGTGQQFSATGLERSYVDCHQGCLREAAGHTAEQVIRTGVGETAVEVRLPVRLHAARGDEPAGGADGAAVADGSRPLEERNFDVVRVREPDRRSRAVR